MFLACRQDARIRPEAENLGIPVFTLPMKSPYDVASILLLRNILKKNRIEIVNTHSGVDSWIGGIAARIAKVPALVRTRHLNIPLKRSLFNFVHYLPDMYITCGENMKDTLVKECGFPEETVISIPTGVQEHFFEVKRNPEAKVRFGLDRKTTVITNVGILRSVKGHEVTLRAVRAVAQAIPGVTFLIVGDGPRMSDLKKMALDLGIQAHVVFTGFVRDIPEIYSFTDVAILSSWSEGLPQSLLQAMAAGIPVVASNVGGVPEVVIDGKTGLVFDAGDSEALAEAIVRMATAPSLAVDCTRSARDLIRRKHSAAHMLDRLEALYARLLK
jgi:glycosyltransferase involved in cell wall biosynthesis